MSFFFIIIFKQESMNKKKTLEKLKLQKRNKLPKYLKFNPIIQFCMFGESGAFQNEYLKIKINIYECKIQKRRKSKI